MNARVFCKTCKTVSRWTIRALGSGEAYVELKCGCTISLAEWSDQMKMMRGPDYD